jgi:hypothetical protein
LARVFDTGRLKTYSSLGLLLSALAGGVMTEKMLPIEADLTLLRAQLPPKRRQSRRFRCNLATMAKLQLAGSQEMQITWAYNLSQGGVGLNAPQAFEVGRSVTINFRVQDREVKVIPATIVFCRLEVDGSWRIGCSFLEPISAEMLDSLLS